MNEDIRKQVEHAGLTYLPPMDRKTELIGLGNPIERRSTFHNKDYESNVNAVVQQINSQINRSHSVLNQEVVGPSGQRIMRGVNTPYNTTGQHQMDKFKDLSKQNSFFTYDIETLGDAMNKTNFSVSEISIMGLHRTGDNFSENGDRFVKVIKPNDSTYSYLQDVITRLEADPYVFNTMTDAQRRSLVDITRYSSLTEGDIKGFNPTFNKNGGLHDFTHNTLANSMFEREAMVNHRVINKMDSVLRHAKQGLQDITESKYAVDANTAINDYNAFVNTRKQSYFVSYNGDSFDVPTLAAWGGLKGNQAVVRPEKHLDYYRVIQTAYPNPIDLHKALGENKRDFNTNPIGTGVLKLPEFMVTMAGKEQAAHNSLVDIGMDGLGGLVANSMPLVNKEVQTAQKRLTQGINMNEPRFTWANEPLKIGQTLFSAGGARARRDGEYSFGATLGSDGKFLPVNNSFNTTIVNAHTAYEVANQFEVGEGNTKKFGLSLYDRERDKYVNIIREGEEAFEEITGFVQNRFYNVNGMTGEQRDALEARRLRDASRRKYEATYSLAGAGTGRANGFELAKRMYQNADITASNLHGSQLENSLKGRMDSLWDPATKRYYHNETEKNLFFRMSNRLTSEKDHFLPAINYIENNISDPAQRDIAWRNYRLQVEDQFAPEKETTQLMDFESKRVYFDDIKTNAEKSLDMSSLQSTMDSVRRQVYTQDISQNEDLPRRVKEDRYRERLNLLVKNLRSNGVIGKETAEDLTQKAIGGATVNNAIIEISNTLASMDLNFRKDIEQTSLSVNKALQQLDPSVNELMFREAVKKTNELQSMQYFPNQVVGSHFNFGAGIEDQLRNLDQPHLSQLSPNNRNAVEDVLKSIQSHNQSGNMNYALSYDPSRNNMRVNLFRQGDSVSVVEQLMKGNSDLNNAVAIDVPLISRAGIHTVGDRKLNARTKAIFDQSSNSLSYMSTAEEIANDYTSVMGRVAKNINQGNFDQAKSQVQRSLNKSVEKLSGIQRNLSFNDTADFNNTQADFFKQSYLDTDSAMIQDLYHNQDKRRAFRSPSDREDPMKAYRLIDSDFKPSAFEGGKLRPDVSVDDLWNKPAFEVGLNASNWFKERDLDLYFGTGKSEMATRNVFSQVDIRDYMPYGHYTFQGRDNAVQYQNTYAIQSHVRDNIEKAIEGTNAYVNFNPLVSTKAQLAYEQEYSPYYKEQYRGMNVKAVMMNDADLLNRIEDISSTEDGRRLLQSEGMLNEDGSLNKLRVPRIYENQGIVAADIQDQMRVREEKILSKTDTVNLFNQFEDGSTVDPGAKIGTERVNGLEVPIYYQENTPGQLIVQNGRVAATWEETPFKYMMEGEKLTDVTLSREMIAAITGDQSTSVIMNADMKKHKDYAMYLSGKAKLMAEELSKIDKDKRDMFLEQAKRLNLQWDDVNQTLVQDGTSDIAPGTIRDVFDKLGINGRTAQDQEAFILEMRASKVRNYSRMTDEQGRVVLGIHHNENGKVQRILKKNPVAALDGNQEDVFVRKGVNWGHREMSVLKNQGLDYTQNQVYGMMVSQADRTGTLSRVTNMNAVLEGVANPNSPILAGSGTLTSEHFEQMRTTPEIDADWNTYRKTMFDHAHVQELTGGSNQHGYWLELPEIEEASDNSRKITANLSGSGKREQIDRIFIPFTNLEGANGQIHLDELQKKNRDIMRRAEEVFNAKSEDKSNLMTRLQESVDNYYGQITKDMTSSKGFAGERVFRADMASSGTGLFKLLDPEISKDLNDEITFVSQDDARSMGLYDTLQDIEAKRAAGETVDDLMVMNTRYPTFHNQAMQLSKIRMSEDVRSGEFLTTSWASDLMNADSDGDYDNIAVLRNEDGSIDQNAQAEWRNVYNQQQAQRGQAYQRFLESEKPDGTPTSRYGRQYNAEHVLGDADVFRAFPANEQDEVAAKIGKRVIGSASNLNYYMRQVADEYLDINSPERQAIHDFGQMVEQKPISSKHGVAIEKGTVPAIDMVNSIYNNDWNTLRDIRNNYYADDFDEDVMERAIRGMEQIKDRMDNGLRSPGLRFGTSYGLGEDVGLVHASDLIHGRSANNERVQTNQFQNMLQRTLGVDPSKTYTDIEGNAHSTVDPYEALQGTPRQERRGGFAGAAGEFATDLSGGSEGFGSKVQNLLDAMSNNKQLKWGVLGTGLALGALGGYNILKNDEPIQAPIETDGNYTVNQPQTALNMNSNAFQQTQSADIQIMARGSNMNQDQLSHMVNEGITSSNMNTGPSRVTINHTDNTNQLNRIWYRDKVQENI